MPTTIEVITALEAKLQTAQLNSDVATLEELLADDLIFTAPNGALYVKEDDLRVHRSNFQKMTRLEIYDMQIKPFENGAVVTLRAEIAGRFGETPIDGAYRYTRIWLQREGRWQLFAAHCSQVIES